jgi:hypothetical protein
MTGTEYNGSADGKGKLPFDGAIGNIVNGMVFTAIGYAVEAVGSFDVTALPDAIEPLVAGVIATGIGLLTTKVLPRFKR